MTLAARIAAYLDETRFRPDCGSPAYVKAAKLLAEVRLVFPMATQADIDQASKIWGATAAARQIGYDAAMIGLAAGDASAVTPEMQAEAAKIARPAND